jgi:hypothetical protein
MSNQVEHNYWMGILVGFLVATIVWCVLWVFVLVEIDKLHKKEIDYIIEIHQSTFNKEK